MDLIGNELICRDLKSQQGFCNHVLRDRPEGYCFLAQDDKEDRPYGIEYSSDIDGNEIDDVEWFATEELRAAEIIKCKNMNFAFPREEA